MRKFDISPGDVWAAIRLFGGPVIYSESPGFTPNAKEALFGALWSLWR